MTSSRNVSGESVYLMAASGRAPRELQTIISASFAPRPPPPHFEKRAATMAERERDRAPRSFHEPRAGLPGLHRKANEFRAAIISRE